MHTTVNAKPLWLILQYLSEIFSKFILQPHDLSNLLQCEQCIHTSFYVHNNRFSTSRHFYQGEYRFESINQIVLHSNNVTVLFVFKSNTLKKIFPKQCESESFLLKQDYVYHVTNSRRVFPTMLKIGKEIAILHFKAILLYVPQKFFLKIRIIWKTGKPLPLFMVFRKNS